MLAVQALGAAALTVAAVVGTWWSFAGVCLWLPAYLWAVSRAGLRALRRGGGVLASTGSVSLVLAVPFLITLAALSPRIIDPGFRRPALGVAAVAAFAGWSGVAVILRLLPRSWREFDPQQMTNNAPRRVVGASIFAIVLLAVPLAANTASRSALTEQVGACPDMGSAAAQAPQGTLRILAEACGQREFEAASDTVGNIRIDVYRGDRNADVEAVLADASSLLAHIGSVLGPPALSRITISPVSIAGPVRGMAGPGYLLIDSAEVASPRDCEQFRLTAGTEGTCGSWVVAHELAHQWFPGTAVMGSPSDRVAWEATADYLAWDWWREAFGEADAARLKLELFEGRMGLAEDFARTQAPGDPPLTMTDHQDRALIRGRGPLGLMAAEQAVGRNLVMAVLERAFSGSAGRVLSVDTILDSAREVAPQAHPVLYRWWLDRSLDPVGRKAG